MYSSCSRRYPRHRGKHSRYTSHVPAAAVGCMQIQNLQPVGNPLCGVQPCQPHLPGQHHPGTVMQDSALMAAIPSVATSLWLPAGQTQSPCEHDAGPLCVAQLAICDTMQVHNIKCAALSLNTTRQMSQEGTDKKQFR